MDRYGYEYGKKKNSLVDGEILNAIIQNVVDRNIMVYAGKGHLRNVDAILTSTIEGVQRFNETGITETNIFTVNDDEDMSIAE